MRVCATHHRQANIRYNGKLCPCTCILLAYLIHVWYPGASFAHSLLACRPKFCSNQEKRQNCLKLRNGASCESVVVQLVSETVFDLLGLKLLVF